MVSEAKVEELIKQYLIELEFADFEEEERYLFEDVIVPIRLYLEQFPHLLGALREGDRKIVEQYRQLPDGSKLREVLGEVYQLAHRNLTESGK